MIGVISRSRTPAFSTTPPNASALMMSQIVLSMLSMPPREASRSIDAMPVDDLYPLASASQTPLKSASAVGEAFWNAGSIRKGADALDEGSAFRFIAETGMKASEHHSGGMTDTIDKHTWIGMSIGRAVENIQNRLQDGLAFLATVGSTAPFVGLFGTVWGIYHALTAIGISGQASIDKVAGPVGEALIMTAIGLAVAVPAVMGYNWLIRRNKSAMESVRAFSGDVHNVLLAGKR